MKTSSAYSLLLILPVAAAAFSSIPADPYFSRRLATEDSGGMPTSMTSPIAVESAPWRVALDIGREPLARMPFDWARSGCRMPLVIPCDFGKGTDKKSNSVMPRSDTVSFTGPDGAVVKPIQGNEWHLTKDSKELSFSFTVSEKLTRRDVYIDAGTELVLTGRTYTQAELDRLNAEYYEAREELWQVGGELGDIFDRQGAAKKWNEDTKKWEKRYPTENPFKIAQKQLSYWGAKAKQGERMSQRPDINKLSDRGSLPGVEGGIYVAKGGVVRTGANGPVCGTWHAQPITGAPVSYRGN